MSEHDPEPIDAELVANEPPAFGAAGSSPVLLRLTSELQKLTQTHQLGAATIHRRIVYALLAETLFEYRADRILLFVSYAIIPFAIVLGAIVAFLVIAGIGWLLAQVGLGEILVASLAVLVGLVGWALRSGGNDDDVALLESDSRIRQFKLGRLEPAFQITEPTTLGLFFGTVFGIQHALLMFTPSHLGLPLQGGFTECGLLTLDNVCHGVFLDTFELYDLHWGDKLRHSVYSATVFYAFRLSFDAFIVLLGLAIWRRFQLQRFFRDFPRERRDVPGVLSWINARLTDDEKWPQRFHDEFVFLLLCREYITGQEGFVRQLSRQLPRLQVRPNVRDLFRAADGSVVFEGTHRR